MEPENLSTSASSAHDGTLPEDVFDRYFAGNVTRAEAVGIQRSLSGQYPGVESVLARPGSFYLARRGVATDKNTLWESMVSRIAAAASEPLDDASLGAPVRAESNRVRSALPDDGYFTLKQTSRASWSRVLALSLMLAILVPAMVHFTTRQNHRLSASSELRTVVAAPGQRVTYHFPDGSSAVLAPGTTLRYADEFGKVSRDIVLDGEALFTVTQTEGVPFLVRSGGTSVRVLGTTFSVRRYEGDTALRVVVAQGKVSVASHILTSGDAATVRAGGFTQLSRGIDIASAMSWTTGQLTFRRTPLRDVIPELERWYGIYVSVTDPAILDRALTAAFLVDEPEGTLNSIAALLRVSMVRSGNQVTFGPPR